MSIIESPKKPEPSDKAADVALAYNLTRTHMPLERRSLFKLIRRWIAGLPPDQADKALADLLHEIEVCEQLDFERVYGGDYSDWHNSLNNQNSFDYDLTDDEKIQMNKNAREVFEDCQRRGANPPHPDCPKCGGSGLVDHTRLWPKGCECIWHKA